MQMNMRAWAAFALLMAGSFAIPGASHYAMAASKPYPSKPIRFIVSYPPSGPADILARELAQKLSERLHEQVVVENRPGANGNIGAAAAARAAPDGYTLFMLTSSHAANMTLYRKPGYDVIKDFAPITNVASYPLLLVTNPSVPAKSVKELIALAKSEPKRLTFASAGTGGGADLAGELFKSMAGIQMLRIPYKGTAPGLIDVIAGRVSLMFAGVSAALPYVHQDKLNALAITSGRRLALIPDIPTVAQAGLPGYEMASWLGVAAPAGTPRSIVGLLNQSIIAVVKTSDFQQRLRQHGATSQVSSPQQFAAYVKSEIAKWAKVIKESGVQIQ
jgi:tripartite-type tricarboxylate transporter receptor subunit TctC